ncbi:MAG TPA: TonB-dependent receptor, partial [Moheibacter sp.]|nr:TonB-dependent receptor [Moheibacter sp.]
MKNLLSITLFLITALLFAQSETGKVRGSVFSESNGETIMGVSIYVNDEQIGMSDLDGTYSFDLAPGIYTISFEDLDYQLFTFENVEVKAGEVTVVEDAFLTSLYFEEEGDSISTSVNLNTVVVTGSVNRDSERALIFMKKNSSVILDGVSSAKMELAGDGTAVEAAKRVTGVSIEGGKYVYVRGLGDRYSKTTLNGMDIPGLDPDRNTLQMDIFPSNLMDNIMVSKNFTADLSADFTGGTVNIETKAFPTKRILNVSYGLGITPGMTFNKDYLYYKGGNTDFLGFDDGTRAMPNGAEGDFPTPINSNSNPDVVYDFVSQFNKTLGASRKPASMNQDFSISYGDQFRLENDNKLAVILGFNYKNETKYYEDYQYGDYQRLQSNPSQNELVYAKTKEGEQGVNSVLMGALAGISYKTSKSRYSLNAMHLQNGVSTAGRFFVTDSDDAVGHSGFTANEDDLLYNQRSLTNIMLQGTHKSTSGDFELQWKLSPTFTKNEDPDIRKTAFTHESIDTLFSSGAGGNPIRIWRKLDEFAGVGKLDASQKYNNGQIKVGAAYTYKQREFSIYQYLMQFWTPQNWSSYDFSQVMNDENIYPNSPNGIWFSNGNPDPNTNAYESQSSTAAGYISNEYTLFEKLKTILGVRVENFILNYTGANQDGIYEDNQERINSTNFFPTANLIYEINDNMNVRLGYARTIARPSFKEASYAEIYDPLTDRTFIGGLWGIGS